MYLGDFNLSDTSRPYIIAELSGNHNQNLDNALKMVRLAKESGADCIKLQTYTPDTLTIKSERKEFYLSADSLWGRQSLYDLYSKAYTPWEWHSQIFEECRKNNISYFSTPFDITAVDFLEKLDVPFYKVASFENTDIPFLKYLASTKKPVILSTGAITLNELDLTVETLRKNGCNNLILLKCTSSYPAKIDEANLLTIANMKSRYSCEVGLSDHTLGIMASVVSVALGGKVIEKHFTISRSDGGVDSDFSIEPEELRELRKGVDEAYLSLGKIVYGPSGSEKKLLNLKRSLYVVKNISKGEIFSPSNLRSIRPACGLPTKYYESILGKRASRDIKAGEPLGFDMIAGLELDKNKFSNR